MADKLGYFENEDIRFIWKRSRDALRFAKRVFCIGYSVPITDLTFRFLLSDSQPDDPVEFYIVNLSEEAIETRERYRKALPKGFELNVDSMKDKPALETSPII